MHLENPKRIAEKIEKGHHIFYKGKCHKMDIFEGLNQYFLGVSADGFRGLLTAFHYFLQI